MKKIAFPLLMLLLSSLCFAQESYWQQHVHYTIDATLNAAEHTVSGTERLVYTNNSPDTLREVYFRLYWNLFTEGSYGNQLNLRNKSYWGDTTGRMEVRSLGIERNGTPAPLTFTLDNTLLNARLPEPLPPGAKITFAVEFFARIPEGMERAGHQGRDYNIAQWYPQISTYDKYGWNKDQYLGPAEFHNEFGTFDVNITLPKSFLLGHSGAHLNPEEVFPDSVLQRLKESEGKEGTSRIVDLTSTDWNGQDTVMTTWKFRAENVRDFAWAANEHYIWDVAYLPLGNGKPPVRINALYLRSEEEDDWKSAVGYAKHCTEFFSKHFGEYAYPNVFVVAGPVGGGMEYPGLTFIGRYGVGDGHLLQSIIVHEVGHNWYPMMIGSNEINYGFMDEGFTVFITVLCMEDYYGKGYERYVYKDWHEKFFHFANESEWEATQQGVLNLQKTRYEDNIATHAYSYRELGLFGGSIYGKTAVVMRMLQYVLGDTAFFAVMREYYNRWKFKHPYPEDFYAVAQQVGGQRDLRWFFDEWFHRTSMCDYAISKLSSEKTQAGGREMFATEVQIRRDADAIMPLDIKISMAGGIDTTVWVPVDAWTNAREEYTLALLLPSEPERAEINPGGEILDIDRLNNVSPLPKYEIRFDNTLQTLSPIDRYLITWRPSLWYTDEGGFNLGYTSIGSYLNDLYRATSAQWYNTRERTLDYNFSLGHNTFRQTPLSDVSLRLYRIEGRKGVTASFQRSIRPSYTHPPHHLVSGTYSYSKAFNREYLLHPQQWDEGNLHRALLGYTYSNRWRIWNLTASATMEGSSSLFGASAFQYSKRTIELRANINMPAEWTFLVRYYNGAGYGDVPMQTKYYFAEGSPLEQFSSPLLRSKGIVPSTLRDHALGAGGGGMRGYYAHQAAGEKIDAFNFEAKFTTAIPFVRTRIPIIHPLLREISSSLFFDAGRITASGQNLWDQRFEVDAGFSLRLNSFRRILGPFAGTSLLSSIGLNTLRVDFPLYVSMPVQDENKLKFRWVLRFSETI